MCIAAGEVLLQEPKANASVRDGVAAWRQILYVIDGTDEQRQAAVEGARTSFTKKGLAAITWSVACESRESQIKYLATQASAARTHEHLAEEPGTPLDGGVTARMNVNALCLAAAEVFLTPPSRAMRPAFKAVTPAAPDAATLRGIRDRTRKEIDAAAGSPVGKALVIDYYRYLTSTSLSGNPQRFLSQTSQRLSQHCRE